MYYVYVLYSKKIDKHYTGYTAKLAKRIKHHNLGLNKWSKRGVPWKLVHHEKYPTKTEAIKRENFLKSGVGRKFLKSKLA